MRYSSLAIAIGLVCFSGCSVARTWTFDSGMLGKGVDVSLFNEGGQLPGTYSVDIILNGDRIDTQDVVFTLQKNERGDPELKPCLTLAMLSRYGVRVEDYPGLTGADTSHAVSAGKTGGANACVRLSAIPQAGTDFKFNNQQLLLSIPQVALRPKLKGIAPEQLWDDGVPALLLNYSANVNRTEYRRGLSGHMDDAYGQLNPGINLGAWRLRNQTSWSRQGQGNGKWQTVQTYAERGLYGMKSRLTLGERQTTGEIFDSVPFRGVMLGSDDEMVPYEQRAFAPIIRGIARTQARVEVRQNDYLIYSATVAPGAFALSDLGTVGNAGTLQVTVRESDGQIQVFTVPYQTPAIALREGYMKYNIMAGQYRPARGGIGKALIGQATLEYGLPWNLTAYGGFQGAKHYKAVTAGMGLSLGDWGSISLDGTEASGERRQRQRERGNEFRLRYSKEFDTTNTTFTLASYQYASSGFSTLADVLDSYGGSSGPDDWWYYDENDRRKSATSLTVNQSMGSFGYLSASGTRNDYWNRPGYEDTWSLGYGVSLGGVLVNLNWSKNRHYGTDGKSSSDNLTTLSVNVPLERWLGGSTYASYQMTSPSSGSSSHDVGLSGQAFDRRLNWNVRQSYQSGASGRSNNPSSLDMTWYGGYGQVGGNYRYSQNERQMGASIAGGVVAHRHGVTFGQPLSDTVVLVEAPGAAGVSVNSGNGIRTDFRGYTLSSMVTPYQENNISLDPTGFSSDAEITQTDVKVVPTAGAVIPAKFATRVGEKALVTLSRPDGQVIPFGAVAVLDGQKVSAGIVGDNGQVYLTGLPERGELTVKWSDSQQCRVSYTVPKEKGSAGLYVMKAMCR